MVVPAGLLNNRRPPPRVRLHPVAGLGQKLNPGETNPYFQLFCGEEFFRHKLPFDRSSLTRWRQRMDEDRQRGRCH
jgi:hypothetical protein